MGREQIDEIGNTEPLCPYCTGTLSKMPGKKTKCKFCGNNIYVRTRPIDNKRVLVTESQVEQIEEQWSIINGVHDDYLAQKEEYEAVRRQLTEHFGEDASDGDIKWALLNNDLTKHARAGNFGLYRNTRLLMAEFLRKENNLQEALSTYIEVLYLDLNGPLNTSGSRSPFFMPKNAMIATGVISKIDDLITKLEWNINDLMEEFLRIGSISHRALSLPLSPANAWELAKKSLYS